MKALFYLPVVTPWWFDHVIEPLIRRLAATTEVFVLAPQPWGGTGIGRREIERCIDLPDVHWCIMEGPDHPSTRTEPLARAEIIDFVHKIAPDYVFCRSADCETVRHFPGKVRFLMEAGGAPFVTPPHWIVLQDQPFDHGILPELDGQARAMLECSIAPAWERLRRRQSRAGADREALLAKCGLSSDRPILLLPLEYEHRENHFLMHRVGAKSNHRLVAETAERIGPAFLLAVTNHPLNELHVDKTLLEATMSDLEGRAVLVPPQIDGFPSTIALAPHAQGMLIGDSKAFSICAFFAKPFLRQSRFRTGDWLRAYSDIDRFLRDVASGTATAAQEGDAIAWSAFHLMNEAFDPQDPDLTAAEICERMERPVDSGRWEAAIARLRSSAPGLFQ